MLQYGEVWLAARAARDCVQPAVSLRVGAFRASFTCDPLSFFLRHDLQLDTRYIIIGEVRPGFLDTNVVVQESAELETNIAS